jgi:hypothetical protein
LLPFNAGFTIDQLPFSSTAISLRSTAFGSDGGRSNTPWTSVYISIFRVLCKSNYNEGWATYAKSGAQKCDRTRPV